MERTPYLKVVGMPREMGGVGAPKPIVFGVLGHTKDTGMMKSLGGLVETSTGDRSVKAGETVSKKQAKGMGSDHRLENAGTASHLPGQHYGQVPYAGAYMYKLGEKL